VQDFLVEDRLISPVGDQLWSLAEPKATSLTQAHPRSRAKRKRLAKSPTVAA
jgi:hypothetical protein